MGKKHQHGRQHPLTHPFLWSSVIHHTTPVLLVGCYSNHIIIQVRVLCIVAHHVAEITAGIEGAILHRLLPRPPRHPHLFLIHLRIEIFIWFSKIVQQNSVEERKCRTNTALANDCPMTERRARMIPLYSSHPHRFITAKIYIGAWNSIIDSIPHPLAPPRSTHHITLSRPVDEQSRYRVRWGKILAALPRWSFDNGAIRARLRELTW